MSNVTKVNIEIETTSDAFAEDFQAEFQWILSKARLIDGYKLVDSNGNTVGKLTVETE